ncbi:5088_t:CDS:1, partial [Cetraspora pellucida]
STAKSQLKYVVSDLNSQVSELNREEKDSLLEQKTTTPNLSELSITMKDVNMKENYVDHSSITQAQSLLSNTNEIRFNTETIPSTPLLLDNKPANAVDSEINKTIDYSLLEHLIQANNSLDKNFLSNNSYMHNQNDFIKVKYANKKRRKAYPNVASKQII